MSTHVSLSHMYPDNSQCTAKTGKVAKSKCGKTLTACVLNTPDCTTITVDKKSIETLNT